MREIYLVGEDEVTKAIIRKIMAVYTPELTVKGELPARGSEIKLSMPTSALQKQGGSVKRREMQLPLKASYYLTHNLALQSSKDEIKAQIGSQGRRCKGKEYNTALVPFIEKEWDVEKARVNSDSLDRMIRRLIRLNEK